MKKYPIVLQYSEEDCGAACLATIVKYYGKQFTINRIREAVGTGQLGTTLTGLRRGAESLGFETTFSYDDDPAYSIIEFKKPGQLRSIKLAQTFGEIQIKN